mmetsp:Transcript_31242/g.96538  ORF Transcript_31242/g.96538 Transcript_31242/m.96538 type:complete len:225 (-) Transcript_31242:2182-2856(-)
MWYSWPPTRISSLSAKAGIRVGSSGLRCSEEVSRRLMSRWARQRMRTSARRGYAHVRLISSINAMSSRPLMPSTCRATGSGIASKPVSRRNLSAQTMPRYESSASSATWCVSIFLSWYTLYSEKHAAPSITTAAATRTCPTAKYRFRSPSRTTAGAPPSSSDPRCSGAPAISSPYTPPLKYPTVRRPPWYTASLSLFCTSTSSRIVATGVKRRVPRQPIQPLLL